jgi:hypothetical protein
VIATRPRTYASAHIGGVSFAAYILGMGLAGPPLLVAHALLALLIVVVGAIVTAYAQHADGYLLGTGVVALGLGGLAAASYGRRLAPLLIAIVGAAIGCGLYFLGVPSGY